MSVCLHLRYIGYISFTFSSTFTSMVSFPKGENRFMVKLSYKLQKASVLLYLTLSVVMPSPSVLVDKYQVNKYQSVVMPSPSALVDKYQVNKYQIS